MLGQRRRMRISLNPALVQHIQRVVFAGTVFTVKIKMLTTQGDQVFVSSNLYIK